MFSRYVALGDSISIDLYPARDAAEREGLADRGAPPRGLGAASLLHRNDDARWPEFAGRDLARLVSTLAFRNGHDYGAPAPGATDNLTTDGATTADVLAHQLPRVDVSDEPTLVTLTAGGNDMLQYLGSARPPAGLVDGMVARLRRILDATRERRPNALVVVGTVYDPSDGTNTLFGQRFDREAAWLAAYNDAVRAVVAGDAGARLADIHRAFLGHGTSAPEAERWYWRGLIFEPSARGASEVRRLWLDAIEPELARIR